RVVRIPRELVPVEIAESAEATPCGARGVLLQGFQPTPPARDDGRAPARVHQPAGPDLDRAAVPFDLEDALRSAVLLRQRELDHLRRTPELRARLGGGLQDVLVELRPVELEPREPRQLVGADLARLPGPGDGPVVEPVPEAVLGDLLAREVVVEAQDSREEPGRRLDRRLPDLP